MELIKRVDTFLMRISTYESYLNSWLNEKTENQWGYVDPNNPIDQVTEKKIGIGIPETRKCVCF